MKQIYLLLAFVLVVFVAACGRSSTTDMRVPVADEIDLASLPVSLDVATVAAMQDRDDVMLFDVREQWEYDAGHIPGITHIPMNEVPDRLAEIPTDKTVVMTCRSGNRSGQITTFLQQQGYENVHNLAGGILAWEQAGYPVEK